MTMLKVKVIMVVGRGCHRCWVWVWPSESLMLDAGVDVVNDGNTAGRC